MNFRDWVIEEMTVRRIQRVLASHQVFGIMSAELRKHPDETTITQTGETVPSPISRKDRKLRTETLRKALEGQIHIQNYSGKKYRYEKANGMWGDGGNPPRGLPERSFLIYGISFPDMMALSKNFQQEAFIHKNASSEQPIMYFLRGNMAGKAVMVYAAKFGHSQALAPKGKRLKFDWKPDRPDWQKEVWSAHLDNHGMIGAAADRFAMNFGNTGLHFDFDWATEMDHQGKELTGGDITRKFGAKADMNRAFGLHQRVGRRTGTEG